MGKIGNWISYIGNALGKVYGSLDNVCHSLGNVCGSTVQVCGGLGKIKEEKELTDLRDFNQKFGNNEVFNIFVKNF